MKLAVLRAALIEGEQVARYSFGMKRSLNVSGLPGR
jgi:hypothetical protein